MTRSIWLIAPLLTASLAAIGASPRAVRAAQTAGASGPFEREIAAYEAADRKRPPPAGAVLFIGSSSIRLWRTLAYDFPGITVINRGFGGSELADSVRYAPRIVIPYRPRMVVLYAGTNDINGGKSPAQVFADFQEFVKVVHAALPDTRIVYISINPAVSRWSQEPQFLEANRLIERYIRRSDGRVAPISYIDTHSRLLGPTREPRPDILRADGLHLNARGYALWKSILRPRILALAGKEPRAHSEPGGRDRSAAPYPPSRVIAGIEWRWDTYRSAAEGSDLWPVTWASDGNLYAAWGDGGGFGGSDQDGRVAMGFARIDGPPERVAGVNVNGGKSPLHAASFPRSGKTAGILCAGGILYAWVNMQNGTWPDVDFRLAWSADLGATWRLSDWRFPKGEGSFRPASFLNFGRDGAGAPRVLRGFVYFYGFRQGDPAHTFLGRVRSDRLRDREAYEGLAGLTAEGRPRWSRDLRELRPVFTDPCGGTGSVTYDGPLDRYLLTAYHTGPGQLGLFDSPAPWGPWTTIAYYEDWGAMGAGGEGLTCDFPQKWRSADGLALWCVFSAYGDGARSGIDAHDRFNLVQAVLKLRARQAEP